MGKKAVKEYLSVLILAATVVLCIFTFIGLYGGDVTPVAHKMRALTTVILPLLIPLNVLALIYWIVRRSYFTAIPAIALLCTINYLGTIYQFGSRKEDQPYRLTVASFNVHRFNNDLSGVVASDVFNCLNKEHADIVCLQEFDNSMCGDKSGVYETIREMYPHKKQYNDLIIFSTYPIVKSGNTEFEMTNNGAMWADIKIDEKHTFRVFNVHMETTGINRTLSEASSQQELAEEQPAYNKELSIAEKIYENYSFRCEVRSGQAITIANQKMQAEWPVILCGDFNDVPYSFTYHTLLGNLKDGFKEGGHGWGSTYRGAKGLFRIDYIFHADMMESTDYYTIDQDFSDHKPVFSRLNFQ